MIVGLLVVPASAVLVTDDGVTVFYDNFESPAAGSIINNGALPGDWGPWNNASSPTAVTRGAETLPPAAYEGAQKAEISGSYVYAAETYMGVLDGVTHIEWMQYTPGTLDYEYISQVAGGAGPIGAWSPVGGVIVDITQGVTLTLSDVRDTWQKWEFDYTANSTDITLTIDGVSQTYAMAVPSRASYVSILQFRGGDAGIAYYIDAVPEPVTLGFLALGGLAALLRRRHA